MCNTTRGTHQLLHAPHDTRSAWCMRTGEEVCAVKLSRCHRFVAFALPQHAPLTEEGGVGVYCVLVRDITAGEAEEGRGNGKPE